MSRRSSHQDGDLNMTAEDAAEQAEHDTAAMRVKEARRAMKRDRNVRQIIRQARQGCSAILEAMNSGRPASSSAIKACLVLAGEFADLMMEDAG